MTRVLALTGATGVLGGRVAAALARSATADGLTLRLVVRDAARAPALPGTAAFVAGTTPPTSPRPCCARTTPDSTVKPWT